MGINWKNVAVVSVIAVLATAALAYFSPRYRAMMVMGPAPKTPVT